MNPAHITRSDLAAAALRGEIGSIEKLLLAARRALFAREQALSPGDGDKAWAIFQEHGESATALALAEGLESFATRHGGEKLVFSNFIGYGFYVQLRELVDKLKRRDPAILDEWAKIPGFDIGSAAAPLPALWPGADDTARRFFGEALVGAGYLKARADGRLDILKGAGAVFYSLREFWPGNLHRSAAVLGCFAGKGGKTYAAGEAASTIACPSERIIAEMKQLFEKSKINQK